MSSNAKVVLFNKPFQVLSQFTDADGRETLKDYIDVPGVYAAGRLDRDSEGLLVLTNDGKLQHKLANPKAKTSKTYWVQVEGIMDEKAMQALRDGVELKDGMTRPAKVKAMEAPSVWPRNPPVQVDNFLVNGCISTFWNNCFSVVRLSIWSPHLTRVTDHCRHRSINNYVTWYVKVRDTFVRVNHRNWRTVGITCVDIFLNFRALALR